MSKEITVEEKDESSVEVTAAKPELSIDEALAEIARLKGINKEVIDARDKAKTKLRSFEEEAEARLAKDQEEQGRFKELYEAEKARNEQLNQNIRNKTVDVALTAALNEAGVVSVPTALKLVDRSQVELDDDGNVISTTLENAVSGLKKEHEILFGKPIVPTPKVKGVNQQDQPGSYIEELKAAAQTGDRRKIAAVKAKYGKNV